VDAQFHQDATLRRHRAASLQDLHDPQHYSLLFQISSYCFWNRGWEPKDFVASQHAFGFHPKSVSSTTTPEAVSSLLEGNLKGPRVVALGEVGLDYNQRATEAIRRKQRAVFRATLHLAARHKLPVVIHCRGYGQDCADVDCLAILREVLPRYFPIHFHCFSSPVSHLQTLLLHFPNSVFGLTSKIPSLTWLKEILTLCSIRRVVLESDAPFISSTPFHLHSTATQIAQALRCDTSDILKATAFTAMRFYSLQQ
jgi:TatD DNase family protein